MLNKTDLLLLLLATDEGEPVRGKTRLVKLLYITSKKLKGTIPVYEFRWHHYGPFSNEIVDDLEYLAQQGLITHSEEVRVSPYGFYIENVYSITKEGERVLRGKRSSKSFGKASNIAFKVKEKYNHIPLSMLIHEVYVKYPLKE